MPHPHGTINRYNNQRCRCDLCRAAIRDYRRAQRAQAADREPHTPPARATTATHAPTGHTIAVLDAGTIAKLTIGGRIVWTCGHVNNWPGPDVARARLGHQTDPSRFPCPTCGTIGIIGTADPWERPDIPRAPAAALVGRAACGHELAFALGTQVAPGSVAVCPQHALTTLRDLQSAYTIPPDALAGSSALGAAHEQLPAAFTPKPTPRADHNMPAWARPFAR